MAAASLLSFSPLAAKACGATATPTATESLEQKFGRKGIKFSESGAWVELKVRNGSSVKLDIPNGHITSYRPKVYWKDDGYEEVLHTLPPPPPSSASSSSSSSSSSSRGGIALVVNDLSSQPNPKAAATDTDWTVKDVDSDSIDALQVELGCRRGSLDISYVVSLYPMSVATAVIVKNSGRKAVDVATAILTHFKSKKRGGSGVQGLKGCSYCTHPPPSSPFQILSPSEATKPEEDPGLFSFGWEPESKGGVWSVQDAPITVLRHKLSRVYAVPPPQRSQPFHATAPSKYETIDQGRELFFRVIRMGFEEIYLSSPGSYSRNYGDDYFICTGPVSMLVPVTVSPGEEWRGAQVIEHDNL